MATTLNPFVWDRPLDDPAKIIGMESFANHVALTLKAQTNVALFSSGANHVSLLFTGSIRNVLKMMLEDSQQPIFGEAAEMQLPAIRRVDFLEYLDYQFEATGKPADEQALEYLLNATRSHPRSTQQLAWECWVSTAAGERVTLETVIGAHERLVQSIERSEFASVMNVLVNGDD